jgi:hypothetical protein
MTAEYSPSLAVVSTAFVLEGGEAYASGNCYNEGAALVVDLSAAVGSKSGEDASSYRNADGRVAADTGLTHLSACHFKAQVDVICGHRRKALAAYHARKGKGQEQGK